MVVASRFFGLWWRRSTRHAMQNRFIDLYSDTKTKPSAGMRKAMAEAEVGDEQKYEDPTGEGRGERTGGFWGKEAAVSAPGGAGGNQPPTPPPPRLRGEVHPPPRTHIKNPEPGGPAA